MSAQGISNASEMLKDYQVIKILSFSYFLSTMIPGDVEKPLKNRIVMRYSGKLFGYSVSCNIYYEFLRLSDFI